MNNLAQRINIPGASGTPMEIQGPLPTKDIGPTGVVEFSTLADVVNKLLPVLFTVAGLILFAIIIFSGFQFLTSGGDDKVLGAAKSRITNALIGFVILVVSYFAVQILTAIFGLRMF